MKKKPTMIPLKDLNLTNRFLFDEVMDDPQVHRDVLSILLEHEVPLLCENITEKELRLSPLARSVRLDVFAMDQQRTVYNTEMQDKWRSDLEKRSRYYQALLDTNLLEPGIPDYNMLNESYIIMVMTYDLFGYGKYCYTFRTRCEEVPGYVLGDQATRIFLNTKGENEEEVSKELVDFLHYVENTTDEMALGTGSERIKRIHSRVCKVRKSEEMGMKYMQAWEEKYYEREEGREEGFLLGSRSKLKEQIAKKRKKGQSAEEIAEALEESVEEVLSLIKEIEESFEEA